MSRGNVFPVRPDPGVQPVDGRTIALHWLADYVASMTFARLGQAGAAGPPGVTGPPVPFSVPRANIYTEDPGPEVDVIEFPAVAIMGGVAENPDAGFVPSPDESTKDVYGQGTVVVPLYRHLERIRLQCWSSELPELRGMVMGIERAMSPTEGRTGIVVALAGYYGQPARLTLAGTEWPQEAAAIRNRRWAFVDVDLELLVVTLVNYVAMNPFTVVDVEIPATSDPRVPLMLSGD
jgi:hypothetical protein